MLGFQELVGARRAPANRLHTRARPAFHGLGLSDKGSERRAQAVGHLFSDIQSDSHPAAFDLAEIRAMDSGALG